MNGPPARRIAQASAVGIAWVCLLALCGVALLHGARAAVVPIALLLAAGAWALDAFVPALGRDALRRGWPVRAGDAPRVALTFDDGPSADTPAVLSALSEAGVRATFFMLGKHAARFPDLVRAVAAGGHAVANHTWSHRVLSLAAPAIIQREIEETRRAIADAGVTPASLFRAPRGFQGPLLRRELRRLGLRLVGWSRGAWDSEPRSPGAIAALAAANPRDGDILLLHDGAGTGGHQDRAATAKAIPLIVRAYRDRGFRFVTVPELLEPGARESEARIRPATVARVASLVILGAIVAWAARNIDTRAVLVAFQRTNPWLLLAAAIANLTALGVQAWRWKRLLRPLGVLSWTQAAGAMVVCFAMSSVLPARAGEVARIHLVARRLRLRHAAVAGSVFLDHLVNGLTLTPLALIIPLAPGIPSWMQRGVATVLALTFAVGFAAWIAASPVGTHHGSRGRLRGAFDQIREGLAAVRSPRELSRAAAIGVLAWLLEGATTWLTLRAMGFDFTPAVAVVILIAVNLALVVPALPGNIGTFEVGAVLALTALGIPRDGAVAFALCYHVVQLVSVWAAGVPAWLLLRRAIESEEPLASTGRA